ncbi:2OG-Fe(II) oxygenase [Phenylobacterium sp.]|uniref:2OG-Fe(II) oxygenase n=1 Tax=Phenylobacterium sp. TaxID=1871053 RepID=UPI003D2CCDB2
MPLFPGAPAPMFDAPSPINPRFAFSSVGGRYIVLAFLPPPGPARDAAVALVRCNADVFRDHRALFFGVLPDAASFAAAKNTPPLRWFDGSDGGLRRLYATSADDDLSPMWVLIDPSLRVLGWRPLAQGADLVADLKAMGAPRDHAGAPLHAPVLIVPRVFERQLCCALVEHYESVGGAASGTMILRDGKTVGVLNDFKSRRDAAVRDDGLIATCRDRLHRRLCPEIQKAFQFTPTYIERYIVARYDAEEGGWFQPHRDNTTPGTAHRKFAVSINLSDDFEGGDLRFPEFGDRTYRPPIGGAVVFSCSLLHEATKVTRGARYAFLPFLYDQAGAEIRAANLHTLEPGQTAAAG